MWDCVTTPGVECTPVWGDPLHNQLSRHDARHKKTDLKVCFLVTHVTYSCHLGDRILGSSLCREIVCGLWPFRTCNWFLVGSHFMSNVLNWLKLMHILTMICKRVIPCQVVWWPCRHRLRFSLFSYIWLFSTEIWHSHFYAASVKVRVQIRHLSHTVIASTPQSSCDCMTKALVQYKVAVYKPIVGVTLKERLMGPCLPILLLVWQRQNHKRRVFATHASNSKNCKQSFQTIPVHG